MDKKLGVSSRADNGYVLFWDFDDGFFIDEDTKGVKKLKVNR